MSRWLKVTLVLAVAAFVVGFRVHTSNESAEPAQAAGTLNAKRASAPAHKPASTVRLAEVAGLPELKGESKASIAARERREAAEKRAKARAKAAAERRAKQRAAARKRAAAKRKKERAAAARRRAAASKQAAPAQPVATPRVVVTPAPTPVYKPPVYTPPAPKKSYVGKDFDSKG
jgi:hypothetical protein